VVAGQCIQHFLASHFGCGKRKGRKQGPTQSKALPVYLWDAIKVAAHLLTGREFIACLPG